MYLNSCPEDTYFEITEIWFHYNDRVYYSERGIKEGSIIYIIEKDNDNITVNSENINTTFTTEEALQICGNPLKKKPKQRKLHR